MDWVVCAYAAIAATEFLGVLVFASLYAARRAERLYGLAALLSLCAAARSTMVVALVMGHGSASALQVAATLPFALALAVISDFSFDLAGRKLGAWPRTAIYAGVPGLVAIEMAIPAVGTHSWIQAAVPTAGTAPAVGSPTLVATVVVAGLTIGLLGRVSVARGRGGPAVILGAIALLAAASHDLLATVGVMASSQLVDLGLAIFIVLVATTPGARFASLARELEESARALQNRAHELRRSQDELRKIQEELLKKEQLAVVGELAAVIAHEVRNPLAIIANAGAGLRKSAISREDHDVLLAILDEETSRLNRLVTDLLRYARPVSVQRTHIVLRDLLERALVLAAAGANGVQTDLLMEANESRLWGDSNLLRQVFDNLIDNALQAMPGGGRLTIRVRPWTRDGADGLGIDIIDTGEGMDTQVRSRALDPFFTTRPSGTGLGLAIVDRIVEAHGGALDIDSRAGEGTTVTVFLPHGSASEPPPPRSRSSRSVDRISSRVEALSSPPGIGR